MQPPTTSLTITAKGQITLRRSILAHLGAAPGDRLDVVAVPGGVIEVRAKPRVPIRTLFGMLARPGQPMLTIEEMNGIVRDGWAGVPAPDAGHERPDSGADQG